MRASFDRFCLAVAIEVLGTMMETDVTAACGPRHGRDAAGAPLGPKGSTDRFHGGKIEIGRPRVRISQKRDSNFAN